MMTYPLDVADGRDIVARWCALAERRLEYLTDLFETGRWRRYHSESAFLENIREAKAAVEAWRDILRREATVDNLAIDMSWLGGARGARTKRLRQTPAQPLRQNSTILASERARVQETLSTPHLDKDTATVVQDLAATADRYPLLRNRF